MYQATLPHIQEEGNLNHHGYENIKSLCVLPATRIYVFRVFEILVPMYQATLPHIQEEGNLNHRL